MLHAAWIETVYQEGFGTHNVIAVKRLMQGRWASAGRPFRAASSGDSRIMALAMAGLAGTPFVAWSELPLARPGERAIVQVARLEDTDWKKVGRPLNAFRGVYSQRDVMQAVRARMQQFTDLRVQVRNTMTLSQGSAPVDIDFSIRGPDLEALNSFSEQMRQAALGIPGIVDVDTTLRMNKPELQVAIDRDRAADLGVDAADIADSLRWNPPQSVAEEQGLLDALRRQLEWEKQFPVPCRPRTASAAAALLPPYPCRPACCRRRR